MQSKEFNEYIKQLQNFYGQELSEIEISVWYENLKFMPVERFNYILSEIYKTNKYMPRLAEILQIHKSIPYEEKTEQNTQHCDKCNDTGYIIYTKIVDNKPYKYAAVCECGRQKRYDGRAVENLKNKSDYYIPTVQEIGLKVDNSRPSDADLIKSMNMLKNSPLVSEDIKNIIRADFKKRRAMNGNQG